MTIAPYSSPEQKAKIQAIFDETVALLKTHQSEVTANQLFEIVLGIAGAVAESVHRGNTTEKWREFADFAAVSVDLLRRMLASNQSPDDFARAIVSYADSDPSTLPTA